jgi:hypothetical protein
MEVGSKVSSPAANAIVVRKFMPTRIEREVLAHVFAMVCNGLREERTAHESNFRDSADADLTPRPEAPTLERRAA